MLIFNHCIKCDYRTIVTLSLIIVTTYLNTLTIVIFKPKYDCILLLWLYLIIVTTAHKYAYTHNCDFMSHNYNFYTSRLWLYIPQVCIYTYNYDFSSCDFRPQKNFIIVSFLGTVTLYLIIVNFHNCDFVLQNHDFTSHNYLYSQLWLYFL